MDEFLHDHGIPEKFSISALAGGQGIGTFLFYVLFQG